MILRANPIVVLLVVVIIMVMTDSTLSALGAMGGDNMMHTIIFISLVVIAGMVAALHVILIMVGRDLDLIKKHLGIEEKEE